MRFCPMKLNHFQEAQRYNIHETLSLEEIIIKRRDNLSSQSYVSKQLETTFCEILLLNQRNMVVFINILICLSTILIYYS